MRYRYMYAKKILKKNSSAITTISALLVLGVISRLSCLSLVAGPTYLTLY